MLKSSSQAITQTQIGADGEIDQWATPEVKPEQRVGCEEERHAVDRAEPPSAGLTLESLAAEVRPILNDLPEPERGALMADLKKGP